MTKGKHNRQDKNGSDDMRMALGGALNGALGRLRNSTPASSDSTNRSKESYAAPAGGDPTDTFFPDESGSNSDGVSLNIMLEDSATAIAQRAATLDETANQLNIRIAERVSGEITIRAQGFRVLVSLLWLGIAAWLYISALNAQAADLITLPNGMAVDDAFVLMRVFGIVAAAGLGVALGIATLTNGFGRGDNRKVRAEGEALGAAIADDALEFDQSLTDLRNEMDRRGAAGDAVTDLSRAHMTALEACAYFRRMPFLTTEDRSEAERQFRGFLYRRPESGPALFENLSMFIAGAGFGALYIWFNYVPSPEPIGPATPLAIMQYPWAAAALMLGGLAYAGAGALFSMLGGLIAGDTSAKARAEALDALRSAFTTREAPRPADVIRRINDAVDVFKARVGGSHGGGARSRFAEANHSPDNEADFAGDETDVPLWRRRDSSVKFVETGFQAAPARWRTNPEENFSADESDAPDAKRSFFGLKNPFRN